MFAPRYTADIFIFGIVRYYIMLITQRILLSSHVFCLLMTLTLENSIDEFVERLFVTYRCNYRIFFPKIEDRQ